MPVFEPDEETHIAPFCFGQIWEIAENGDRQILFHGDKTPVTYKPDQLPQEILDLKEGDWFQSKARKVVQTGEITKLFEAEKTIPPVYLNQEREQFWNQRTPDSGPILSDRERTILGRLEFERAKAAAKTRA